MLVHFTPRDSVPPLTRTLLSHRADHILLSSADCPRLAIFSFFSPSASTLAEASSPHSSDYLSLTSPSVILTSPPSFSPLPSVGTTMLGENPLLRYVSPKKNVTTPPLSSIVHGASLITAAHTTLLLSQLGPQSPRAGHRGQEEAEVEVEDGGRRKESEKRETRLDFGSCSHSLLILTVAVMMYVDGAGSVYYQPFLLTPQVRFVSRVLTTDSRECDLLLRTSVTPSLSTPFNVDFSPLHLRYGATPKPIACETVRVTRVPDFLHATELMAMLTPRIAKHPSSKSSTFIHHAAIRSYLALPRTLYLSLSLPHGLIGSAEIQRALAVLCGTSLPNRILQRRLLSLNGVHSLQLHPFSPSVDRNPSSSSRDEGTESLDELRTSHLFSTAPFATYPLFYTKFRLDLPLPVDAAGIEGSVSEKESRSSKAADSLAPSDTLQKARDQCFRTLQHHWHESRANVLAFAASTPATLPSIASLSSLSGSASVPSTPLPALSMPTVTPSSRIRRSNSLTRDLAPLTPVTPSILPSVRSLSTSRKRPRSDSVPDLFRSSPYNSQRGDPSPDLSQSAFLSQPLTPMGPPLTRPSRTPYRPPSSSSGSVHPPPDSSMTPLRPRNLTLSLTPDISPPFSSSPLSSPSPSPFPFRGETLPSELPTAPSPRPDSTPTISRRPSSSNPSPSKKRRLRSRSTSKGF